MSYLQRIMVDKKNKDKELTFLDRLKKKDRLVVVDLNTYEEIRHFNFSALNIIIYTLFITLIIISITWVTIAFTPIKQTIPGYPNISKQKQQAFDAKNNLNWIAQQESKLNKEHIYYKNLQTILSDSIVNDSLSKPKTDSSILLTQDFSISKKDSILREKIKEDAEKQFQTQADQQLLNAVTEYLVENTKFDLPAEFLKKWLAVAGEKPISAEQAAEEYEKSEKGLRYQLIEGKVLKDNDIKLDFEELKDFTKGFVKAQMAQYGQLNPEEKELDDIVQRVLSNQDEAKRLQEQLVSQKLLAFYKEKITFKVKEMNYEDFVKEVYK